MIRLTTLLAVIAVALASVAATSAAPPKLIGSVGPGFTITLKMGASKVASLKHGKYTFVIRDQSAEHDFHLTGPVNRTFTGVSFTGTKTVTLTLKPGRYSYVCDPHADQMRGSFRVK
jgi:plastocyanin